MRLSRRRRRLRWRGFDGPGAASGGLSKFLDLFRIDWRPRAVASTALFARRLRLDDLSAPAPAIEAMALAGLVAASYASTNLDNFLVVSAYAAKSRYRPFYVKLTFVLVSLTVVLLSFMLALAADRLVADKLRYLGVIPIGLGLYYLARLVLGRSQAKGAVSPDGPGAAGWSIYLGFALALLANSSDSVIVLAPLFADIRLALVVVCALAAVAVAIAMSSVATLVANHPLLREKLERWADWALPFLLIAIGLMIVLDKPADIFVEERAAAIGGAPGGLPGRG